MAEQNFVYVDADYLKELEETAKKVDYYKDIIDGIMVCTQTYDDKYWLSLLQAVADGEMSDTEANQAWLEYINRKDEPTISKMEQVDEDINVRSKTENSSEKPNNCEHITEDGVTCAKYPACDDCLDNPLNKAKGSERLLKGKDEPQTPMCETCRYDKPNNPKCDECIVGDDKPSNYEPQTDCPWK